MQGKVCRNFLFKKNKCLQKYNDNKCRKKVHGKKWKIYFINITANIENLKNLHAN